MPRHGLLRCARNDGWAEFCGLTCRCATQNMHEHPHRTHTDWLREHGSSITTPLAAGGRVFVHHDEQLPLEATRPGLLGTPGLVYSSSLAASGRLGFNAGNGPSGQAPIGGVAVFLGLCHGRGFAVLRGLRGIAVRTAPNAAACRRCWSMRPPGRTPAPCQYLVAIEFGVAAGSTDPLRSAVSIQEIGKNVSKAFG